MGIRSPEEGFAYIESFTNLEKKTSLYEREYRLDRVKYLFSCFGQPNKNICLIHVAGSKGKGSTAAFAASILTACGFRTGLYTSPHLLDYRERITLAGNFFPDSVYTGCMERIRNFLESEKLPFDSPPTTFELLTLLAFLVFSSQDCSWAVIETGIGGRLDATNIIMPRCSVITPVELEHQDILGNTLEEIASEKSGIIKEGIPAVTASQRDSVLEVLRVKAENCGSFFTVYDRIFSADGISVSGSGTSFTLKTNDFCYSLPDINGIAGKPDHQDINRLTRTLINNEVPALHPSIHDFPAETHMIGSFQAENAALAASGVLLALLKNGSFAGFSSYAEAVRNGIKKTSIPGRIEFLKQKGEQPAMIIDSSHTPGSAATLRKTLDSLGFTGRKVLIFGSVEGKDYKKMFDILSGAFRYIIISTPGNFKKSNPEEIYSYFREKTGSVENGNPCGQETDVLLELSPSGALKKAAAIAGKDGLVVVTGSFYMAGGIKKLTEGGTCGISA